MDTVRSFANSGTALAAALRSVGEAVRMVSHSVGWWTGTLVSGLVGGVLVEGGWQEWAWQLNAFPNLLGLHTLGDKELFRVSFHAAGEAFVMVSTPTRGGIIGPRNLTWTDQHPKGWYQGYGWRLVAMIQSHPTHSAPLFVHRTQSKLTTQRGLSKLTHITSPLTRRFMHREFGAEFGTPAFAFRFHAFAVATPPDVSGVALPLGITSGQLRGDTSKDAVALGVGAGWWASPVAHNSRSGKAAVPLSAMGEIKATEGPLGKDPSCLYSHAHMLAGGHLGGLFSVQEFPELAVSQRVFELAFMEVAMDVSQGNLAIFDSLPGLSRWDVLMEQVAQRDGRRAIRTRQAG